jgi:hypothetical protein
MNRQLLQVREHGVPHITPAAAAAVADWLRSARRAPVAAPALAEAAPRPAHSSMHPKRDFAPLEFASCTTASHHERDDA